MHGALLVDKPSGPTSHDIVAFARRGAEDAERSATPARSIRSRPACSSLLVGHATRLSQFLVTDEKEYLADIRLGLATDTYDAQGSSRLRGASREARLPRSRRRSRFAGSWPISSARSLNCRRLSQRRKSAECGRTRRREERARRSQARDSHGPELELSTARSRSRPRDSDATLARRRCSSGLLRPLAGPRPRAAAGLRRPPRGAAADPRRASSRWPTPSRWSALEAAGARRPARLIPIEHLLPGMPAVTLTDEGQRRARNGNTLAPAHLDWPLAAGRGRARKSGCWTPSESCWRWPNGAADGLLHPLLVLR